MQYSKIHQTYIVFLHHTFYDQNIGKMLVKSKDFKLLFGNFPFKLKMNCFI